MGVPCMLKMCNKAGFWTIRLRGCLRLGLIIIKSFHYSNFTKFKIEQIWAHGSPAHFFSSYAGNRIHNLSLCVIN